VKRRPVCVRCGRPLEPRATGRRARYCSTACRVAAHRARARARALREAGAGLSPQAREWVRAERDRLVRLRVGEAVAP
jgi:hypothetical protein